MDPEIPKVPHLWRRFVTFYSASSSSFSRKHDWFNHVRVSISWERAGCVSKRIILFSTECNITFEISHIPSESVLTRNAQLQKRQCQNSALRKVHFALLCRESRFSEQFLADITRVGRLLSSSSWSTCKSRIVRRVIGRYFDRSIGPRQIDFIGFSSRFVSAVRRHDAQLAEEDATRLT